jgi:hypothetical protein
MFFFGANFHNLATKKGLVNPTKGFLKFVETKSPYVDQKNQKSLDLNSVFLQVGRTRKDF